MDGVERRSYNAVRTQDQETLSLTDTGSTDHSYSHTSHDQFPTAATADSFSIHSRTPLSSSRGLAHYPPPTEPVPTTHNMSEYPPRHGGQGPYMDMESRASSRNDLSQPTRGEGGQHRKGSSWDLLSNIKNFETEYTGYDSRKASEAHLAFADGDIPNTRFAKLYHYLINASVITRWILFIVPFLALLWIPGIIGLTAKPNATLWEVKLVFWSIWFSVVWGGWWACLAIARILPAVVKSTIGVVLISARRYIEWFQALNRYVTFFLWMLTIWITFTPVIRIHSPTPEHRTIKFINQLLFAFFLCAAILLGEKFSIQWIAGKFHEKSYAERIGEQKFAIKVLTTLYRNSRDIPGRPDTMGPATRDGHKKEKSLNPKKFFKQALGHVRFAATSTTTALGNVASEMTGTSVLQPNSPQAMVMTAIHSLNKTRLLARRLFYSFAPEGRPDLISEHIAMYFPNPETAELAFTLFDRDSNGDVTRDELEDACINIHREQLSIEHSMRDLDSAVGRLDNILMSLYFFVCVLVIAIVLDQEVVSFITGAGTLIIGLSWLVGGSLTEVLSAIIFLFIKHPYDVGDRVSLDDVYYTVKEIRLLSTIFVDENGASVQAPNAQITTKFILNVRRSGQMSEPFAFDVAFGTTFEQLEELRGKMVAWLVHEKRDYLPSFDLAVVDIPDQDKMSLKVDIRYKSNWQQPHVRAKRRNKWVCTLKAQLKICGIYGPGGGPTDPAGPAKYTLVPYEKVLKDEQEAKHHSSTAHPKMERMPTDGWNLNDKSSLSDPAGDIFDEASEREMTNPRRGASSGPSRMPIPQPSSSTSSPSGPAPAMPSASTGISTGVRPGMPAASLSAVTVTSPGVYRTPAEEYIELRTPTAAGFPSTGQTGYMEHRGS